MGLKQLIAKSFFDFAYAIAYRPIPESSSLPFLKGEDVPFRLLKPTLNQWYADPIIAMVGEKEYLFMEVYDRTEKKGMIGVSSFSENGQLTGVRIILNEPFHLSFPLVFDYMGKTILMPECSASHSLRFYELDPQTLTPSLIREIPVEGAVVDTVVLKSEQEELVLLGCMEDSEEPKRTSLVMYHLDGLYDGELKKCTLPNEYAAPSYRLRNGGPVICTEDKKIRILQESTETEYGHNLIFREILNEGTDGTYLEKDLQTVYLEDVPIRLPKTFRRQGTHTYSIGNKAEVMDVSFNRFHIGNLFKQ